MWKVVAAFAVFSALALFILMKSGGDIDLSGEKHDVSAPHEPAASAAVAAAVQAASMPASAPASAPAAP